MTKEKSSSALTNRCGEKDEPNFYLI